MTRFKQVEGEAEGDEACVQRGGRAPRPSRPVRRRDSGLRPTEMPAETDEAAPSPCVDAQLAGTATGTAGSSKMKMQKNGLKPLRIPKREMSYTLNANACGLATFSYKARDPISGQLAEHTLAERGEKGYSLNALAIGPELGHGQGGCVRLSRHEVTGVDYALKEVSIAEDGTRHQVMRELAVYRQCQSKRKHPNIVALFDAFYAEGRVYMVLELMTWGSLELALLHSQQQHARAARAAQKEQGVSRAPGECENDAPEHGDSSSKSSHAYGEREAHAGEGVDSPPAGPRRFGGMDEAVLAGVAGRVLQALAFLFNEHAIVHRDIKPGNVMLSRDGSVKLSDFGVSICGAGDTDHVAGTAGYMSPERLEGNVCSHRGDIWAVGIMLLECAKGRHPLIDDRWKPMSSFPEDEYQGEVKTMQRSESGTNLMPLTHCDVWAKVVKDDAPSARGLGYSEDLESFVAACLKKDKDLRPTAETLLQTPLVEKHEARQQETMRDWLVRLGEPNDPCMGGVDEPMVFTHWNANPLLPPPTPRGEQQDGGKQQDDSPPSTAGAVDQQKADADCDLSRMPLQFLLQPNLEAFEAEVESARKRQRTNQGIPQ